MRHHGGVNDLDPTPTPDPWPAYEPAPALIADTAPLATEAPADAPEPAGPRTGSARQNRLAVLGTVVALVVLAFGGGVAVGRVTAPGAAGEPVASAGTGVVPTPPPSAGPGLPSDGARLGRADAKVVVDYWADYQCPFCSKFAQEMIPQLAALIEDGTVALVHHDFAFIGPESTDAAVAVRCAIGEGSYWQMHDAVYAAQSGENKGAFAPARLAQVAASVGLDPTAFGTCMGDHATRVAVLDETGAGVRSGITSTPTIDVNGHRFLGVPKPADLLAAISAAAAGASPEPLPSAAPMSDPWSATTTAGRTAGDAAAPLTVELWMDYQAKGSTALANDLEPGLRDRIASGAIRVVRHDLALLGTDSSMAAVTVRCTEAQAGPAWFVHDILAVSAQGAGTGILDVDNILTFAARLGLHVAALDTCLADASVTDQVAADTAAGQALGLDAGPAVIVRRGDAEVARYTGELDAAAILTALDAVK